MKKLDEVQAFIRSRRTQIAELEAAIEKQIFQLNPGLENKLKGNQLVAYLGEFYASYLLEATVCADEKSNYDLLRNNDRIEVKTRCLSSRSSKNYSWKESSSFSLSGNSGDPTHLCFVLLNSEDYSLNTVWLFRLAELHPSRVRKGVKKVFFKIHLENDLSHMIYPFNHSTGKWLWKEHTAFIYGKSKKRYGLPEFNLSVG